MGVGGGAPRGGGGGLGGGQGGGGVGGPDAPLPRSVFRRDGSACLSRASSNA